MMFSFRIRLPRHLHTVNLESLPETSVPNQIERRAHGKARSVVCNICLLNKAFTAHGQLLTVPDAAAARRAIKFGPPLVSGQCQRKCLLLLSQITSLSYTPSHPRSTSGRVRFPVSLKASRPDKTANQFGYPRPVPDTSFSHCAHYFIDDNTWDAILDHNDFDDVVVGSGFCALAYIEEPLRIDSHRKTLILGERRGFWLPTHFQNLSLPFRTPGGSSETLPCAWSSKTGNIPGLDFMHASCPFFGGKSTFWSAWCPSPKLVLMRGSSQSMMDTAKPESFWKPCKELLHVIPANEISDAIFGELQDDIDEKLQKAVLQLQTEIVQNPPLWLLEGILRPQD
ncbi:fad nad -binding domain-containing protein [Moniliophthora roreri MCA 2997]|uniref:Fad nad-binding domain-containing protein n=2 Tax=Moniliophthora roreri TaxID=221103 RepID=V2XQR5_MONRO|nr:fad nad -binding domain-containing protein [Moniliophthora roreri MCA 2997]